MWGLIDCDNFFCSCEKVFRPDLNGVPVVVLSNNDGCVVARSHEAKSLDIPEGMPYYQLLEKYPRSGIVAFSSNYALYGDMSARVMAVLREEAPEVIQYSIDEAFLNLEGMDPASIKEWGERLCAKVRQWTGIPVSLGIAPTKTLAKVASKFAKEYPGYHKCCAITCEEQRIKALKLFPVKKVWGIGRKITKSLALYGISNAYEFTCRERGWVKNRYHITGERTWKELRGENVITLEDLHQTSKQSIMTSRSFPGMITSLQELSPHVANYASRCAQKLRGQCSVASVISVFIQSNHFRNDLPQYDNMISFPLPYATNSTSEIVATALDLLRRIYRVGISYKRAGVMVAGISSAKVIQPDLFFFDPDLQNRYRNISEAIDEINTRLGADTIILASQQYMQKASDGRNLKFTDAIKRALKSPSYSTHLSDFRIN